MIETITMAVEELTCELIDEVMPVIKVNHKLTGQFEQLDIDWDSYLSLGTAFVPFVMRDDDAVVGILFFMIGAYPHNMNWMMAQQVTFYVNPDHRAYSMRLMKYSEEYLRKSGVTLIVQAARVGTKFCQTLERKGYEATDVTYCKRLY